MMTGREYIVEITDRDIQNSRKHVVRVFWKDPFGVFNERSGCFIDYQEAVEFRDYLGKKYRESNMPYFITFDGATTYNVDNNGRYELTTYMRDEQEVFNAHVLPTMRLDFDVY